MIFTWNTRNLNFIIAEVEDHNNPEVSQVHHSTKFKSLVDGHIRHFVLKGAMVDLLEMAWQYFYIAFFWAQIDWEVNLFLIYAYLKWAKERERRKMLCCHQKSTLDKKVILWVKTIKTIFINFQYQMESRKNKHPFMVNPFPVAI